MDKIISYLVERLAISERKVTEIMAATISVLKQRLRLHEWILINDQLLFFIIKKTESVLIDPIHHTKALIPPTLSISFTEDIVSLSDKSRDIIVRDLATLVSIQADLDEQNAQLFTKELTEAFNFVLKEDGLLRVEELGIFKRISKRGINPKLHRKNASRILFIPESSLKEDVNKAFSFFEPSVFAIKELPNNAVFFVQKEKPEIVEAKETASSLQQEKEIIVPQESKPILEETNHNPISTTSFKKEEKSYDVEKTTSKIKEEKKIADFVSNVLSITSPGKIKPTIRTTEYQEKKSSSNIIVEQSTSSIIKEAASPFFNNNEEKVASAAYDETDKSAKNKNISHQKEDFSDAIDTLLSKAKNPVQDAATDINEHQRNIAEKNEQQKKGNFSDAIGSMLDVTKDDLHKIVTGAKSDDATSSDDYLSALYISEALSEKVVKELKSSTDKDANPHPENIQPKSNEEIKNESVQSSIIHTHSSEIEKKKPFQKNQDSETPGSIYNQIDIDAVMNAVNEEEEAFSQPEETPKPQEEKRRPYFPRQEDSLLNAFDIDEIMDDVDQGQRDSGYINKEVSSTMSNLDNTKTNDVIAFFGEDNTNEEKTSKYHHTESSSNKNKSKNVVSEDESSKPPKKKEKEKEKEKEKQKQKNKKKKKPVYGIKYLFQHYFIVILTIALILCAIGFILSKTIEGKSKPEVIEVAAVNSQAIDDQIEELLSGSDTNPKTTDEQIEQRLPENNTSSRQTQPTSDTVIIQGNITLQSLSQKYYGNEVFWVYLYEANKDEIEDIHQIEPGTRIIIPNFEANNFDVSSEEAIQLAKRKEEALLNEIEP